MKKGSGRALAVMASFLLVAGAGAAAGQKPVADSGDESLRLFLQEHFGEAREAAPTTRYAAAAADLDGDGRDEALVYLFDGDDRYWCGSGGCDLYVFEGEGNAWRLVSEISVARLPIRMLDSRSHGWRDLGVFVAGGGVARGYEARLRFDGRAYPDNPTAEPAEELTRPVPGTELIPRDPEGLPLF